MNITTTHKLAERLIRAGGTPVSGQQLAEEFGISRTAVWKHIEELREAGYDIQSIRKKGYRLTGSPDTVRPEAIQPFLQTARTGKSMEYRESVSSTQIIAHELAQNGAADGTVVLTETQTAGRGRMARKWDSAEGKGIWMSIILRPDIPPQRAPQFTLVAAVAVVRAIEEVTGLTPQIKWPNDILLNGRKCTGILTELQADMDHIQALIIGIGLNANQTEEDFPEDIRPIATSLRMEKGGLVVRAELVRAILTHLEVLADTYVRQGFTPLRPIWEGYSNTIGRRIRATTSRTVLEGLATGITDDGVLQLRTDDGELHAIYSADIELSE